MAADQAGYVLPEKWSEDLVDEKGEKLSKRCELVETVSCGTWHGVWIGGMRDGISAVM